jgi:hypothetical protein
MLEMYFSGSANSCSVGRNTGASSGFLSCFEVDLPEVLLSSLGAIGGRVGSLFIGLGFLGSRVAPSLGRILNRVFLSFCRSKALLSEFEFM